MFRSACMVKILSLKAGTIIVMDRAYNDYAQFGDWCMQGVYFVTRKKSHKARYYKYNITLRRDNPWFVAPLFPTVNIITNSK